MREAEARAGDATSGEPVRVLLSGATGVGKTALAVELAEEFPLEIVSADSMQVYRGLEIGTAQPTAEERARAAFHGCGELAPDAPYDAQRFLLHCAAADTGILARGRLPVYVGGTGLYLRALRWGLFEENSRDEALRGALEAELAEKTAAVLHARLAEHDPEAAGKIHPHDPVRIVRALEIIELTGQRPSELLRQWERPRPRLPHVLVVLTGPREWLRGRIAARTRAMLAAGWIEEVEALLAAGYAPELHCFKAIGYREIMAHLRGEMSRGELEERIVTATQQYAKRQMTWMRRERPALWVWLDGSAAARERAVRTVRGVMERCAGAVG